jgi:transposase InsO family protein
MGQGLGVPMRTLRRQARRLREDRLRAKRLRARHYNTLLHDWGLVALCGLLLLAASMLGLC